MHKVTYRTDEKSIVICSLSRMIMYCAFITAFLSVASCATTMQAASVHAQPSWVTMPSSVYQSDYYFSAVGEGTDRSSAELDAVRGVASYFGQNINSVTAASARMEQAMAKGKVALAQASAIDQTIIKNVNQDDIIGVETKETWYNSAEKKWYAVAVLDRAKTAALYESMIKKNNEEIASLTLQNKAEAVSFETYVKYDFAAEIAAVNDGYIKRLSVITFNEGEEMRKVSVSEKDELAALYKIAQQIPVTVRITSADDAGTMASGSESIMQLAKTASLPETSVSSAFSEVIAGYGFNTGTDANERYVISGTVTMTASPVQKSDIAYQRYQIDSYLTDTITGEKLLPFAASGREGAKTDADAKVRASAALAKRIKNDFGAAFNAYLKQLSAE